MGLISLVMIILPLFTPSFGADEVPNWKPRLPKDLLHRPFRPPLPKNLAQRYRGLFQTEREAKFDLKRLEEERYQQMAEAGMPKKQIQALRRRRANHDFDSCCPTTFWHGKNNSVTTVEGETRTVIHMSRGTPPTYQFLPHGTCTNGGLGNCEGRCIQEHRIHYVLVLNFEYNPPLSFERVLLPAYCSCKNIAN